MKVQIDENGYVQNFVIVGESSACDIEVEEPENFMSQIQFYTAWHYDGAKLTFDEARANELQLEGQKNEIRQERARECFTVINRGQLWYETLNESEKEDLNRWYQEWLDAPETMKIPEKLEWLK